MDTVTRSDSVERMRAAWLSSSGSKRTPWWRLRSATRAASPPEQDIEMSRLPPSGPIVSWSESTASRSGRVSTLTTP